MWRFATLFLVIPNLLQAGAAEDIAAANDASKSPYDYYCTGSDGSRHELGEVVCLVNNSCQQIWMAKCDMSLNNPMWRKVQDGCPAATLLERFDRLQPGLYSFPVDVKIHLTEPRATING